MINDSQWFSEKIIINWCLGSHFKICSLCCKGLLVKKKFFLSYFSHIYKNIIQRYQGNSWQVQKVNVANLTWPIYLVYCMPKISVSVLCLWTWSLPTRCFYISQNLAHSDHSKFRTWSFYTEKVKNNCHVYKRWLECARQEESQNAWLLGGSLFSPKENHLMKQCQVSPNHSSAKRKDPRLQCCK